MMGRIRTIKPEFPQSESIGRISRDARLLLLQLLTLVDDAGRCRGTAAYLRGQLYPYDDAGDKIVTSEMIDVWLTELINEHHIIRYRAEDSHYIEICQFLKHQKIDRPSPSRIPSLDAGSMQGLLDLEDHSLMVRRVLDDGPVSGPVSGPVPASAANAAMVEALFEQFWTAYPKRDGGNPKKPAFEKFKSAVKGSPKRAPVDPELIIAAAKVFANKMRAKGKIGTEFIPMAQTWLHQARWEEYRDQVMAATAASKMISIAPYSPQWEAWRKHYIDHGQNFHRKTMDDLAQERKNYPAPSEWPPPAVPKAA